MEHRCRKNKRARRKRSERQKKKLKGLGYSHNRKKARDEAAARVPHHHGSRHGYRTLPTPIDLTAEE